MPVVEKTYQCDSCGSVLNKIHESMHDTTPPNCMNGCGAMRRAFVKAPRIGMAGKDWTTGLSDTQQAAVLAGEIDP